jgi:hypothetical protein
LNKAVEKGFVQGSAKPLRLEKEPTMRQNNLPHITYLHLEPEIRYI